MTLVEYYLCPVCGKTTPLKSFNPAVDPHTLGFVQIRKGGGRGSGFRFLEQRPLMEVAQQYPEIVRRLKVTVHEMKDLLPISQKEKAEEEVARAMEYQIYEGVLGFQPEEMGTLLTTGRRAPTCPSCRRHLLRFSDDMIFCPYCGNRMR